MGAPLRVHGYGIQVLVLDYPHVYGCGLQYAYQISQGIYINNVGLMCLVDDEETMDDFSVNVVVETEAFIRHKPIPLAQRSDANENSTNIPTERDEPIRK